MTMVGTKPWASCLPLQLWHWLGRCFFQVLPKLCPPQQQEGKILKAVLFPGVLLKKKIHNEATAHRRVNYTHLYTSMA